MHSSGTDRTLSVSGEAIHLMANGSNSLQLYPMSGEQTQSPTYWYQLYLLAPQDLPDKLSENLDLLAMIGREPSVTITLDGCSMIKPEIGERTNIAAAKRQISGIIASATLLKKQARQYLYRFNIEPWIALAKQSTDYRIFQEKSVLDITEGVLGSNYLYSYDIKLSPIYPLLDYKVQYAESGFDCIQRRMEPCGIYWFFRHDNDMHRMMLVDSMDANHPVKSQTYRTLPPSPLKRRLERGFITYFANIDIVQSKEWTADDFDFKRSAAELRVHNASPKTCTLSGTGCV